LGVLHKHCIWNELTLLRDFRRADP